MISSANNVSNIRIKVKRQDGPDKAPYWDVFEFPYKPAMNIISCLQVIASNPVTVEGRQSTPVTWDSACLEEVCGSCTMVVNGRVRQSCSALVDDIFKSQPGNNEIVLEPMTKFPVVRDLWVDRSRMFNDLIRVKAWVPIDGTHNLGMGPRETPENQDVRYALSRCMTCGCCLEACPQYTIDNNFIGPQAISQARYFNLHETGATLKDERLTALEEAGGINDCGNAQNCVKVCPKEIPLTESIAAMGRQVTVHAIKKFFTGK